MAGRNHQRIGIRASAIHDRENSPVRVVADLQVVFVDEGLRAEAEARQIVFGFRPSGGVEFRSVDEDESDSEGAFDIERVPVNDAGDVALDAQTTERGHADGFGFGTTGGGLLASDAGAIGGRVAIKTAAITTIEIAVAMTILARRREIIRPSMGRGFHQPHGRATEEGDAEGRRNAEGDEQTTRPPNH